MGLVAVFCICKFHALIVLEFKKWVSYPLQFSYNCDNKAYSATVLNHTACRRRP